MERKSLKYGVVCSVADTANATAICHLGAEWRTLPTTDRDDDNHLS